MKRIFTLQSKTATKAIVFVFIATLLLSVTNKSKAQILITLYKETFPNKYNEFLSTPVNQVFNECTGNWSSSTTNNGTVGCFEAPYSPVTNALKMVHPSTTGLPAADAYATSPLFDLGNPGCYGKYDFYFKLYTYNCVAGDYGTYLAVEFSKDGGTTWDVAWQMTSAQIYNNYGVNAIRDMWLALPSTYLTPNFRYRFRSHMNANNANNFYVFIDEPIIYAFSCATPMSLGNLVWLDINQNGIKDGLELGLAGVPLQLIRDNDLDGINDWDFTPQTTITDINGNYSFTNLNAGRYKVTLAGINAIYRLTGINAGAPDEDGDNNNNGLTQSGGYTNVDGGWITLLPQSEPINDGDGNNSNQTYDFAIYPAAALPVKSVALSLNHYASQTTINWNTINEVNVLAFEVERSVDNKNFEKIAVKASSATVNGNAAYSATDITGNNFAPVIYYRIKIIDKDGRHSYSNTATLKFNTGDGVTVWPNPFVQEIKISHTTKLAEKILVKIADNTGKVLKTQAFNCIAGTNQFIIGGLDNLSKGLYTVTVSNGSGKAGSVLKIIK